MPSPSEVMAQLQVLLDERERAAAEVQRQASRALKAEAEVSRLRDEVQRLTAALAEEELKDCPACAQRLEADHQALRPPGWLYAALRHREDCDCGCMLSADRASIMAMGVELPSLRSRNQELRDRIHRAKLSLDEPGKPPF